jgi:hypothetical protein
MSSTSSRVRGYDRVRLADRVEPLVKVFLDIQPLDHRFGDPVAIGELFEIVACIAEMNEVLRFLADQARLIRVAQAFETAFGQRIGVIIARQVQQPDFDAGVRYLSGDTRPHGAGADYRYFFNAHPFSCAAFSRPPINSRNFCRVWRGASIGSIWP